VQFRARALRSSDRSPEMDRMVLGQRSEARPRRVSAGVSAQSPKARATERGRELQGPWLFAQAATRASLTRLAARAGARPKMRLRKD
jgi:hypothetical protein